MSSVPSTTGLPINQLITNPSTSAPKTVTSELGPDAFLKLLTAQLQNQDPLHPMDQTQSVAQLAQFSALQASTALKDSFATFQSNFSVMQSAGLIGKSVSAQATDSSGTTVTVTGTVKTITVINGQPQFTLAGSDGKLVTDSHGIPVQLPTSAILSIG
jgi:flagellar basal-body rod modification protein FlgD